MHVRWKLCLVVFLLLGINNCESANDENPFSFFNVISDNIRNILKALKILPKTTQESLHEDIYLNITELLTKYGYPVEVHEVLTSDDYILKMFRIPHKGPAVLVLHGGGSSSDDFITIGPQAGLAYVLADAGYDVWLGNFRGNKHSNTHAFLSPESFEFADYTFDENGRYDQPAMIDYVLEKTKQTQVKIIGHSQGTTSSFILCSEKPEYNDKISIIIALSPVVILKSVDSPLFRLSALPMFDGLNDYVRSNYMHTNNLLTENKQNTRDVAIWSPFCETPDMAESICYNLLGLLFGTDYEQINKTSLPAIFGHFPSLQLSSIKMLEHYRQLLRTKKFANYDYGSIKNKEIYGSISAPEYPIEKVTTKVAVFYGKNDWISTKENIDLLVEKLPNVIEYYTVPLDKFTHADVLWAKDVKYLVYDKILEIFRSHSQLKNIDINYETNTI